MSDENDSQMLIEYLKDKLLRRKSPSKDSDEDFIEDGDTVIMKGFAEKDGIRVGFGEVSSKVLPAN